MKKLLLILTCAITLNSVPVFAAQPPVNDQQRVAQLQAEVNRLKNSSKIKYAVLAAAVGLVGYFAYNYDWGFSTPVAGNSTDINDICRQIVGGWKVPYAYQQCQKWLTECFEQGSPISLAGLRQGIWCRIKS